MYNIDLGCHQQDDTTSDHYWHYWCISIMMNWTFDLNCDGWLFLLLKYAQWLKVASQKSADFCDTKIVKEYMFWLI